MCVRLWNAIEVLKVIAINVINCVRRLCLGSALLSTLAGVQNPEIREDLSGSCGVLSLRTELPSAGCLLLKSGLRPFRLRFPIKSRGRRHFTASGTSPKRGHLSVGCFLNSVNPHLLKEDFREKTYYSRSYAFHGKTSYSKSYRAAVCWLLAS